jgi:hypothetical protein
VPEPGSGPILVAIPGMSLRELRRRRPSGRKAADTVSPSAVASVPEPTHFGCQS